VVEIFIVIGCMNYFIFTFSSLLINIFIYFIFIYFIFISLILFL